MHSSRAGERHLCGAEQAALAVALQSFPPCFISVLHLRFAKTTLKLKGSKMLFSCG